MLLAPRQSRQRVLGGSASRSFLIRSFLLLLLLSLGFAAWNAAPTGTTYYVRTDGGDASQCTGLSDAPYPGSGVDQACAWMHPFYAMEPGGTARLAGGDTLIIGSGGYMMGQGAPGAGNCLLADSCHMPPIPSGPRASARTRVLGSPGEAPPRLWGTSGVSWILNLDGSSNVEIGNLEITDQDDCIYSHSDAVAKCPGVGIGAWAKHGLYARASSNVWLHDLDIHGLGHTGLFAGGLTDWTLERVKLNKNGRAGWDTNIGVGSSNAGTITLRNLEIGWNGCGERWQTGEVWGCWGKQSGGYGDGLGTTATDGQGGQWLIEDAYVHHNTQDGIDLYYLNGANTTHATLRRVHVVANAGHQVKVKGSTLIENSVVVGHCSYFKNKYFMLDTDLCRAYGASVLLVLTGNDTALVRHNSIGGEGPNLINYQEGDATDEIHILSNVGVGFPYYRGSGQAGFAGGPAPGAKTLSDNIAWNTGNCPIGVSCGEDPKLTNMALATFDAEPLADSPVLNKVPPLSDVTSDFLLQPRPYGSSSDIGAYELQMDATPVCTRAAPTISLSAPTAAVPAGSTVEYTLNLSNNDSSACATTSFSLAEAVPSGWTGALADANLSLAAGASGSTTLSVTSASSASEGDYGIGVGVSSSVGSVHTANASATYAVAAPAPVCTRAAPTVSLSGPTAAVPAGSTVSYTINLSNNDSSACATTSFSLADSVPSGWTGNLGTSSLSLAAGASGSTTLSVTSESSATEGDYGIGVGVSSGVGSVHTANASATYAVAAPAPVCTRAAPTVSLSGPTAAVPAGSTVSYTVDLSNNDSGSCATTSFSLAEAVPSGWTGTLADTSLSLAAGASGSTTLSVTSESSASEGNYNIGVGVSSGIGSVHTANASATYAVAAPAPVCTRAAPTVSLSGPTVAVPAGSTVGYTVNLSNNDSGSCATTSFSLTESVPNGWTGTLADTSLSLTAGASGSTTLSVASASSASEGSYSIGVDVSSSVGGVHTANASASYAVAAPGTSLQTDVGTNKGTYARGETVQIYAFVRNNGVPVAGAVVDFIITRPNGGTATRSVTSGSDGYARTTYKIGKATSALGTYTVQGSWSQNNVTSSATATFTVL